MQELVRKIKTQSDGINFDRFLNMEEVLQYYKNLVMHDLKTRKVREISDS